MLERIKRYPNLRTVSINMSEENLYDIITALRHTGQYWLEICRNAMAQSVKRNAAQRIKDITAAHRHCFYNEHLARKFFIDAMKNYNWR